MNAKPNIDMLEATRLTREGRLAEAMAVLRGGLAGANPSGAPSDAGGDASKRPSGHFSRIIDMVPPSSGGGAWTPPQFDPSHFTPKAFDSLARGSGQAHV